MQQGHAASASQIGSFADAVDGITTLDQTVLGDVAGQRLRARQLLQNDFDRSQPVVGRDHVLVFQLGGAPGVRRFYDGVHSGTHENVRHATLSPAFRPSQWELPGEVNVLHIYLDDARFRRLAEAEGHDPAAVELIDRLGVEDPFLEKLAPAILHELHSPSPASSLMIDGFDMVIAGHLLRSYSVQAEAQARADAADAMRREKDMVERAKVYMLERMDEAPSFDEVAAAMRVPPFTLRRHFRRETGRTPHEWLTEQRVTRAAELLRGGNMPLIDVALACGFCSQSHLTDVFRRQMHFTPARYRKERRS